MTDVPIAEDVRTYNEKTTSTSTSDKRWLTSGCLSKMCIFAFSPELAISFSNSAFVESN